MHGSKSSFLGPSITSTTHPATSGVFYCSGECSKHLPLSNDHRHSDDVSLLMELRLALGGYVLLFYILYNVAESLQ
jgi:hypothetical protein